MKGSSRKKKVLYYVLLTIVIVCITSSYYAKHNTWKQTYAFLYMGSVPDVVVFNKGESSCFSLFGPVIKNNTTKHFVGFVLLCSKKRMIILYCNAVALGIATYMYI